MVWAFEDYVLDGAALELRHGDELVPVEPQVFQVLVYLVESRERVVSKEELLDNVWGSRFVSESALTSRIKSARQAVGDSGREHRVIRTFHGNGYRFVAAVDEVDPATDDGRPSDEPVPIGRPELSLAVDREFGFVGRSDVMGRAIDQADRTEYGPQALLLGGEPGVGKSRLALEIASALADEQGYVMLGGRCEQHLASSLQPWLEALHAYVSVADADELRDDSVGIADRLAPVLPSLATRLGHEGAPPAEVDEYAVLDGIVTMLERASRRRPMVVVLDDVHWAGGATRSLASLLLRRGIARILVILTYRTTLDDLGVATGEWLAGVERAGAIRETVTALTPDDVAELVDAALGDIDAADAVSIWERSEGHSLFAVELIRDLIDGGSERALPATVASLVQRRLTKLPDDVARLVVTGAAVGQEFELSLAAAVADLGDADALDAADGALGAQLLHEVPGRVDWYRFSHQLVPAAALESMSRSRRVRLHARVAAELQHRDASGIEIAHHLIEASAVLDPVDVVERVRSVTDAALRMHQYDRAVELLERAASLDIDERLRAEVLCEFGAACNLAGQQPRALDGLARAADAARRNGWDDVFADAALGMWGQSPFRASQDQTVIPMLDEAIDRSERLDDRVRARLLAKRAAFNLFSGPMEERDRLSAEALQLVGPDPTYARLEVLEARWMAIASPSKLAPIVELDTELETLRKELGTLSTDACAPEISIYWRGEGDRLRDLAADLRDDPRQRREVDQWRTTALSGCFALLDGELDEARSLADRALPLGSEPWGEAGDVVHALVHLATDVLAGESSTSVDNWRRVSARVPSDAMRANRAWAEALWGDRAAAHELVDRVMPRVALLADNFMGGFGLVGLSEAAVALGRTDVVADLTGQLVPLAGQMLGHPWAPCFAADDALARLLHLMGDPAAADASVRALELYDRLGAASFSGRLESALA